MSKLAFLDLETTGLDPRHHEIWEVGVIVRSDAIPEDTEYRWQLRPDLHRADPKALEIGRYHERFDVADVAMAAAMHDDDGPWAYATITEALMDIQDVLAGSHIVGAVPSFDDGFLKAAFHPRKLRVGWHYHLCDVENLAVGYLAAKGEPLSPPWDSEVLSERLGIEPSNYDRHTALGDARWARDIYDAVMAGTVTGTSKETPDV